ncbi:TPA: CPBP family intramembrane metalloprotease [Streptococcus agalactiae]|nr:CPBP family intramembrane metalloprotease [Streptococcus agalactiae]HEO2213349.1 CPBP family intramembrane metalloprotease [Streptococcus agalactiae]
MYGELGTFSFSAFLLLIWVKFVEKRPFSELGFSTKFKRTLWSLIKGWSIGFILFSISVITAYILGGLDFHSYDVSKATIFYVVTLLPFWLIQSGTEELLTRGWLLPLINHRFHLAVAIGVSSTLFGILHLVNAHVTFLSIVSIICSGVLMSLYMIKSGNIWSVAALHGAWNFSQGNLYGIAVSGQKAGASLLHFTVKENAPDWISGGAFGIEGSLISIFVLLAAIIYVLWLIKTEETD